MAAQKWGKRAWAVVAASSLALGSARCVSDFVNTPNEEVPPSAVGVRFLSEPASATAGTSLGSSIQVAVVDSLGVTVTEGNTDVTLTLGGGTPQAHLRGTVTATSAAGIATFSGLSVDSAGSNYTLTATASGLTAATSLAFSIRAGPPVMLQFVGQPTNAVAMNTIAPSVRVGAADSLGNAVEADYMVSLELNIGQAQGNPALMGDARERMDDGVASFEDLRVTSTGSGFRLTATAAGLPSSVSQPFDVVEPTDVIALRVTAQPGDAPSGGIIPTVRVVAVNSLGNVVPSAVVQVTLSLVPGTGTAGARLGGTTTASTGGGEAIFSTLTIDSAGTAYRLLASAPSLTADTTTPFAITAGNATRLAFQSQPTTTQAGAVITPAPSVAILDAAGNVVTSATNTVAVYITAGTGSAGATLGGTASVAAVAGVATFSNLTVSAAGTGYTLTAAAPGLAADLSAAFAVTAPPPPPQAVASVTLAPDDVTLLPGDSVLVIGTARDSSGQSVTRPLTFTWSSSDPLVTVTADGANTQRAWIRRVGLGLAATVTATTESRSGTATIR